ncbi:MAG: cytochrome c [Pseudomonadota bacterium]
MSKKNTTLLVAAVVVLGILYWAFGMPSVGNPEIATDAASIERGAYLYQAGGCGGCHELEGAEGPSGGYEIESPFGGTFHVPNITPDVETGIGGWSGKDFLLAIKHGRKPSGGFYWPAFPFRSYKDMSDQEVLDVAAYLQSIPAISNQVVEHDLPAWQFSWMMAGWNIMAGFLEGTPPAITSDDPQIQRGAYLARALGHCGECHTPRNVFGMMQLGNEYAGADMIAPEITPSKLSSWSQEDFVGLLQLGMTANFDFVGGEMEDVVKHTSQLTEEDQAAYAAFFTRDDPNSGAEGAAESSVE